MDCPDALLVGCPFDRGMAEIGLSDALDRSRHVHDLVGQHTGQPLPRFHLVLGHQLIDYLSQIVERLLQGPLPEEEATGGQMEGEIPVADRLSH